MFMKQLPAVSVNLSPLHHLVLGGLALHGDLHQDLLSALACQRAAAAGSGGHLGAVSQGGGSVFLYREIPVWI